MVPHSVLKEAATMAAQYTKAKIDANTQEFLDALEIDNVDVLPEKVKFELGKVIALAYRNGYLNHYESTQKKVILM